MSTDSFVRSAVIGALSGYVGVRAMSPVTTKVQELQSPSDAEREKSVSPGIAYTIAAKDLAVKAGMPLDEGQSRELGNMFHIGLGLVAGEIYMLLREGLEWSPPLAALIMGVLLWAGIDEGLTPAMGWSAQNSAYPLSTHVRGGIGHLTLAAATASVAELLRWLEGQK